MPVDFRWRETAGRADHEGVQTTRWTEGGMRKQRGRHGHQGFSLIEVVVAAAIFSLGLGSMSLLLVMAVHGTYAPRSETLAALHAQSLANALRLVPDRGLGGAGEPGNCMAAEPCSPSSMAESFMESWQRQIQRDLPTGRGLVCQGSAPAEATCTTSMANAVTVIWRSPDPESGDETSREFVLGLPIP
jgi:prepilin-type N-terminal cleavage/methylation domain-containing protein